MATSSMSPTTSVRRRTLTRWHELWNAVLALVCLVGYLPVLADADRVSLGGCLASRGNRAIAHRRLSAPQGRDDGVPARCVATSGLSPRRHGVPVLASPDREQARAALPSPRPVVPSERGQPHPAPGPGPGGPGLPGAPETAPLPPARARRWDRPDPAHIGDRPVGVSRAGSDDGPAHRGVPPGSPRV